MIIPISIGKVIVTPFEVVIKLEGSQMVTLQASRDTLNLIGRGANVVACNTGEAKWSIKLDNEQQLQVLSQEIGVEID
ncbi:DUF3389 domain-containing protein [Vibrio sp. AK197]|uniref:DUF3389 family protein n=1 Tax=Vibrio olivae TaxID=1243002 RepID=A0ABV5HRV8_9VIBR